MRRLHEHFFRREHLRSMPRFRSAELAAYTAVANMILNLDEVITKG